MSFANTLEAQILDHLFGLATWTAPTNLYIGLSTADPLGDGSGLAEPVGNGYARVLYNPGSTNWLRAGTSPTTVDNKLAITFAEASGAGWGTISHACLFTALSGGIPILSWALDVPKLVDALETVRFAIGTYNVTCD
jgi:hypothetical protein